MKLNLGCGINDIRTGYINIDKFKIDSPHYKQGDIINLDWLTEDNKVEESLPWIVLNIYRYSR